LLNLTDAALNDYRRSMIGFVWQQGARNLIPYLNALENVELPMTLAGYTGREKRQKAEELLEAVGLSERRKHRLQELSGGEQQRVAIAVSLANNPRLLLADEPTGELDSATALTIYKTLQDLNQRYGLTILIVSHDTTIARHVHRVVAIRDGKLATETVRQTAGSSEASTAHPAAHEDVVLEELTVIDSAGRLQLPKEYVERLKIKGRVRLELTEDGGILIRPAGGDRHLPSAELLGAAMADAQRQKAVSARLRTALGRWMNNARQRLGRRTGSSNDEG
jgi:ABC-type lipoprotein export system ATPase subunit/bifunctional DNA-binding transcriptional regulator/antitoxin component of YhaV-PrlF toxin-antitoxin module